MLNVIAAYIVIASCTPTLPETGIKPGTYKSTVEQTFRGFNRDYLVHIPTGFSSRKSHPLVVVIHGAFSSASEFADITGFSDLADEETFVVIYPNGVGIFGFLRHWNAGFCCAYAAENTIEDTSYVKQIIDDSLERLPIDRRKVYLVGFSNGGMLVYRFAAEYPEYPAAIASVSATIGAKDINAQKEWKLATPEQPVTAFIAHGTADTSIPYDGGFRQETGGEISFYSVNQSVAFWLKANQCSAHHSVQTLSAGAIELKYWGTCKKNSKVKQVSIKNWDHQWPGSHYTGKRSSTDPLFKYDLTRVIWDFFTSQ
jgi:polyhydroxybutyrate depolymerase